MDVNSSSPIGEMEVEGVTLDSDMLEANVEADIDILDADNTAEQTIHDAYMTIADAEGEVEMTEVANGVFVEEHISYEDDAVYESEPRSPSRVQTQNNGQQIQALGHTSRVDDKGEPEGEVDRKDEGSQVSNDRHQPKASMSAARGNGLLESPPNVGRHQSDDKTVTLQYQEDAVDDPSAEGQEQTLEGQNFRFKRLTQPQSQAGGDGFTMKQINEANVPERNGEDRGLKIQTTQHNSGTCRNSEGGLLEQIDMVNVLSKDEDCASIMVSDAVLRRPKPAKNLIRQVSLAPAMSRHFDYFRGGKSLSPTTGDAGEPLNGGEAQSKVKRGKLRARPVQLTFEDATYSMFCPPEDAPLPVETFSGKDEAAKPQLLFGDEEGHGIYFHTLESLCAKLHDLFPDFDANNEEMVMTFSDLGISVPEDNLYTREISLYDLDRLHGGANLPGCLLITLDKQPRLIHRFNVLAEYVSRLLADEPPDADDADHYADAQQASGEAESTQDHIDGAEKPESGQDEDEADAMHGTATHKKECVGSEVNQDEGAKKTSEAEAHADEAGEGEVAAGEEIPVVDNTGGEDRPTGDHGEDDGEDEGGTVETKLVVLEDVVNYDEEDEAPAEPIVVVEVSAAEDTNIQHNELETIKQLATELPDPEELIDYDAPLPDEPSNSERGDDDRVIPTGTLASAPSDLPEPAPAPGLVTRSRKRSQDVSEEALLLTDINLEQQGSKKARVA